MSSRPGTRQPPRALQPRSHRAAFEAEREQVLALVRHAHDLARAYTLGNLTAFPSPPPRRCSAQTPPCAEVFALPAGDFGGVYPHGDVVVGLLDKAGRPVALAFLVHLEDTGKKPARDLVAHGALNMHYVAVHGGVGTFIQASPDVAHVIHAHIYPSHVTERVLGALPPGLAACVRPRL